jgi:8-oxo-dGTP diphosphatase
MTQKPFGLAVKAVIVDGDGRSLLIRRSRANRNFVGEWEWPGGKSDPREAFDDALKREVREECGLEVEITGVVGAMAYEMPAVHVVLLCLETRVAGGELKLSEEHDQFAWVPFEQYAHVDLVDNVRPFMLDYAAKRGMGR